MRQRQERKAESNHKRLYKEDLGMGVIKVNEKPPNVKADGV